MKPRWAWQDEHVTRIRKLMLPALFGVSVSQINLLLDAVIASFLMTGSVAWLYYSDRLSEFPLGMFGIAIATVILPNLSRQFATADHHEFKRTLDWSVSVICLLGLPSMAGLIVLAEPILLTVFAHGKFTAFDASQSQLKPDCLCHRFGAPDADQSVGAGFLCPARYKNAGADRDYCHGCQYGV